MIRGLPEANPADPMGTVAGRVAEEIGTALTAIAMAVDRLERQAAEEGCLVHSPELNAIRTQSGRLAWLARQLLELARPPSAAPTRLELNGETERALSTVRRELDRLGVTLRFHPSPEELAVLGDPHRFREAFLALLGNAQRAARSSPPAEGGRWVEVRVVPGAGGGGEVRVRDSGPGVPEGEEELIFIPFFSRWGGDGMGLSLSRLSAMGQGGTLEVQRDDLGQSEFVLALEPYHLQGAT
jgi:signal transduction histidine kinase